NIVDGQGSFFSSIVISTLEAGTTCHGYVTDCKGTKIFDRGTLDCTGTCMVSQRDNIPGNQPYCPHMVVHTVNGKKVNLSIKKVNESSCFEVGGKSDSISFAKTECPADLPKSCSDL
ncbi:15145_t:CDS:2, partial [Dentiscutata heterogama]